MNRWMNWRLLIIGAIVMGAQVAGYTQLNIYSFSQIDSLQQEENRYIIIFIHTDWCKYCHAMKQTTLKDDQIVRILNENFWFGELNAEEKKDIIFKGQLFKNRQYGNNIGVHELANQLVNIHDENSYPALCILNPDNEIIFQDNQFLSSKDLFNILMAVLDSP